MTNVSKKLEQIVKKELAQTIIPVKTDKGILVGQVLITSEGSLKNLYKNEKMIYSNIHLNCIAVRMANILAFAPHSAYADKLYKADQEYGKWFVDNQILRAQYQKYLQNKDYEKADLIWAKYQESRDKTLYFKTQAETLAAV